MNDTYTPEEFARCYSLRGYGRKKYALAWMQALGMEEATYVAGAHGQQSPQGQKEKLCRG